MVFKIVFVFHKVDNLVRDNADVLVDGELGIVFSFLPRLITFTEVPSNRGACGGGWWTDRPPIFHFIL